MRLSVNFLEETLQAKKERNDIFKVLKESKQKKQQKQKTSEPHIQYLV